jgi:ATP-dependent Lon protease
MVLFPGVVIPITAGRDKSIKLMMTCSWQNNWCCSAKKMRKTRSTKDDIHSVGTVARILRFLKMTEQLLLSYKVKRFEIDTVTSEDPYINATIKTLLKIDRAKTPSF